MTEMVSSNTNDILKDGQHTVSLIAMKLLNHQVSGLFYDALLNTEAATLFTSTDWLRILVFLSRAVPIMA